MRASSIPRFMFISNRDERSNDRREKYAAERSRAIKRDFSVVPRRMGRKSHGAANEEAPADRGETGSPRVISLSGNPLTFPFVR